MTPNSKDAMKDSSVVKESISPTSKKGDAGPKSQKESIYKGVQLDIVKVSDLINPKSDKIDTLDPYCIVRFGNESVKGTVHANGGKSCSIDDTFYFPYQAYQYLRSDLTTLERSPDVIRSISNLVCRILFMCPMSIDQPRLSAEWMFMIARTSRKMLCSEVRVSI